MVSERYDIETDVIVVGCGAAGAASAISAQNNGADVLILEKMPQIGGNTAVAGGNMIIPREPEKFAEYMKKVCFGTAEPEIIDTFVQELVKNPDWLKKMEGGELRKFVFPPATYSLNIPDVTFPGIPGAENVDLWCVKESEITSAPTGGARLLKVLSREVERRGIKVMTSTPAKELIQNEKGEIIGVVAESEGKDIAIKAKRGVIMTCGGFENDDALKWDNLVPKPLCFYGSLGNTGDGIRMTQKVGATMWHMDAQSTKYGFKPPEFPAAFAIEFTSPGFIYVDKHGRRFVGEGEVELHLWWEPLSVFDYDRFEYTRVPFYAIFDEEAKRTAPICYGLSGYNVVMENYKWSTDNSTEIKKGWIIKAKNIHELAKRLSMDESTLENTITKYNEFCRAGKDADFSRSRASLKVIDSSPLYAIELRPTIINTQGGPRRDKEARILDPYNKPIPRLYSAGEFGSIWGFRYQTSTNLSECLVFGRIAGRNAATSSPVES